MKKLTKKVFAVLLAVMLVFVSLPMTVIAESGESTDEYIEVRTIEDLYNIRLDLTANYILMNDIDLTDATAAGGEWDFDGRGWNPIGSEDIYSSSAFSGIFDGNGYSIKGMRIEYTSSNYPSGMGSNAYVGLFAKVTGEVRNLKMEDVSITNAYASTTLYVGAITGYNTGTITNCSVSGSVSAIEHGDNVGGIAGYNNGTIGKSYNTAIVVGYKYVGGISGNNLGTVINCYNTGSISYKETSSNVSGYSGGIVGCNEGGSSSKVSTITNCYNIGEISGTSSSSAYAVAHNYSAYSLTSNSYYLSGTGVGSTGATALTDAQILTQSLYVGFDFDGVWEQNTNAVYVYPQLTSNIQDNRDIIEAKIATLPNKTVFTKEQPLDVSGCTLLFTYSNSDDEIVYVTEDMVTGYDADTVGTQELTIAHNFRTFKFDITVEEKDFKEIYTILDLYNIRYDLNANYILMNDIDLTDATAAGGEWDFDGRGWNPIGSEDIYSNSAFSGIFDGNGYSIKGMRIEYTSSNYPSGMSSNAYIGLFSKITGEVRNLKMEDVNIPSAYASTYLYVGAITGSNWGVIKNCSVSGNISAKDSGDFVGGLSGYSKGTISKSYNTATVVGYKYVGGISGNNLGTVINCYNTGSISYKETSSNVSGYSGGIVGCNEGGSSSKVSTITNCYNIGEISGTSSSSAYAIAHNYSAYSLTSNSYYLSGTGVGSTGATALTDAQMKVSSTYLGFDMENLWYQDTGAIYPYPQVKTNTQDIRVIDSARIYSLPHNLIYTKGDELNTTGLILEFKFKNADTEYVDITSDMVTGFESTTLGMQTLSVTYYRTTFTFDVTVNEKPFTPIYTVKDLYDIRNDLTGNYILMNDIDLTDATAVGGEWDFDGRGWNPIGSNDVYGKLAFSGIFDGNGYAIIGMRINVDVLPSGAGTDYSGLFANVTGQVRNLEMRNVNISNATTNTGAIAAINSGTIINCSVSGIAKSGSYVGGLVGENNGTIQYCFNNANVSGSTYAGGIAAKNVGEILDCYNSGAIAATSSGDAGSIAGVNSGASSSKKATIKRCYNVGAISAANTAYVYAIALNSNYASVSDSYYLNGSGKGVTGATALTDAQMRLESMYSGFDFNNTWTINAYANHPYPQLKSNIQDLNETVTLIRVIAYPAKMDYLTGDELNMVGGMFEAIYISGKTDVIALSNEYVTGYDPNVVGTQTLTVTYGGQTDTFEINVFRRPVATSVTILTEPTQKEFVVGTKLDFSGATVKVEYDNNTSEVLDVTTKMTTGANIDHMGTQTVTVTIDGCSDTFEIKVVPASIYGISIATLPNKVTYIEGEKLDTTGLAIVANYTNGSEISIASGYTVSGYDANKIGEQTVTVDFVGKKATFTVTVVEKVLTNIEIQAKPKKLNYVVGEELDLTGMVVVASYETGELVIIDDYTVSGFDGTAGSKVITVAYKGKSASFTVNVAVIAVEKLTLTQLPVKLAYIENEPLNTQGLIVTATYNDGTVKNVTDYDVVGFSSLPGVHTLYVVFGGQVASFQINVSAKKLSDVRVVLPEKTTYFIGEEFDATGMQVIACYNNGQEHIVDGYTMTGFDSLSAGAKEIVITYGGFTRSFAVAVVKKVDVETDGAIKVGNLTGRLGEIVEVPVTITHNPGLNAFCHTITFDASNLKFVSAAAVGAYANGNIIVNNENAANGEITVLWFGATDVVNNGDVYKLSFEVLEAATDGISEIAISFDENDNGNISGENILFGTVNGYVDIRSYWLGDLNGDRKYAMVDLLQLAQYVSGKEMTLTEKQKLSADVNEDGNIDIHDVSMLNQWLLVADM